ncbi:HAD family hydrolase [Paenibacillus camelliae]|uniref:HAD family hydrolase n=1 Tax=Paenibacillus camelliae TaxID=512410 RepID=UPI00203B066C|nr:Cof-type HAD-IIB family hydrolase [Paenibacillus camelliae]
MDSNIRSIVSDLDGTLLGPDHSLPNEVITAIQAYKKQGGLFTIATGRPLLTAQSIIDQIGIEIPVILCNGAVLAVSGKKIERICLEAAVMAEMVIDAHAHGLMVLLFREDHIECFAKNEEVEAFEHKERIKCNLVAVNDSSWRAGELEKVILLGEIEAIEELWSRWSQELNHIVEKFQSEPNYMELISAQTSKGKALERLSDMLGIDKASMMAIGNQMNDLPMLEAAGVGVAVANSPAELKAAADYICSASYGAGVVEAINNLVYGRSMIT